MFHPRRPTLSARAVRLLYQFGFICSGTAAGLVTLCLEEQRRRIQILQKVADNARTIRRAASRHRGSHALAVERGDSALEYEGEWSPAGFASEGKRRDGFFGSGSSRGRQRTRQVERSSEIAKATNGAADVASPLAAAAYKPFDWRAETERPSASPSNDEGGRKRPFWEHELHPGREEHLGRRLRPELQRVQRTRPRVRQEKENVRPVAGSESELKFEEHARLEGSARLEGNARSEEDGLVEESITRQLADETKGAPSVPFEGFDLSSSSDQPFLSGEEYSLLLHLRLRSGSLSEPDLQHLADTCKDVGSRIGLREAYTFFAELFSSEQLVKFETAFVVQQALTVALEINSWETSERPELRKGLLDPAIQRCSAQVVSEAVETRFATLISQSETVSALVLLDLFREGGAYVSMVSGVVDRWLDRSIRDVQLPQFASVLQYKIAHLDTRSALQQLELFIKTCKEAKSYRLIAELFDPKYSSNLDKNIHNLCSSLGVESTATIVEALAIDMNDQSQPWQRVSARRSFLTSLLLNLPKDRIPPAALKHAIDSLKVLYQSTRNFDLVNTHITALRSYLEPIANENLLKRLEAAKMEISIQAGVLDQASETLSAIGRGERGIDAAIASCQTALALANEGSWDAFSRFMERMKERKALLFFDKTVRMFNAVIHRYAEQHSPRETWDFVVSTIDDLGFVPTSSTAEIVLQAFVAKNAFDLVPEWLDLMEQKGFSVAVDSRLAAELLQTYYRIHRPSHTTLMWLCRRLVSLSPSLAGKNLVNVVEIAISYDLTHNADRRARVQKSRALRRLERLRHAGGFIPSPGYAVDAGVVFHDEELDIADLLPSAVPGRGTEQAEVDHAEPASVSTPSPVSSGAFHPFGAGAPNRPNSGTTSTSASVTTSLPTKRGFASTSRGSNQMPRTPQAEDWLLDRSDDFEPRRSLREMRSPTSTYDDTQAEIAQLVNYMNPTDVASAMWKYMSLGQYDAILELYFRLVERYTVPPSPEVLQIAVTASLRLHTADSSHAEDIISKAAKSGMNVSQAKGQLLIHDVQRSPPRSVRDARAMTASLREYYRTSKEGGRHVPLYFCNTTAHSLMLNGFVRHALSLLVSMDPAWSTDPAALTLFLRGSIMQQNLPRIQWVVNQMLEHNVPITLEVYETVRRTCMGDFKRMDQHGHDVRPLLLKMVQDCRERKLRQRAEAEALGWKLVKCLAKSTKESTMAEINAPNPLEDYVMGLKNSDLTDKNDDHTSLGIDGSPEEQASTRAAEDAMPVDEAYFSDEGLIKNDALRAEKKRMVDDMNAELAFRKRMRANPAGFIAQLRNKSSGGPRGPLGPRTIPDAVKG